MKKLFTKQISVVVEGDHIVWFIGDPKDKIINTIVDDLIDYLPDEFFNRKEKDNEV